MTEAAFIVPGPPVPKERPRKGRGHWYTPQRTIDYEQHVRTCALGSRSVRKLVTAHRGRGDYALTVRLYFPDRRARDADNCCKAIQDALNKLTWADDRQIVEVHLYKSLDVRKPRAEVAITNLEDQDHDESNDPRTNARCPAPARPAAPRVRERVRTRARRS